MIKRTFAFIARHERSMSAASMVGGFAFDNYAFPPDRSAHLEWKKDALQALGISNRNLNMVLVGKHAAVENWLPLAENCPNRIIWLEAGGPLWAFNDACK